MIGENLLFCFYQFSIDFITRFVVSFLLFLILFSPIPVGVGRFFVCRHCAALRYKNPCTSRPMYRDSFRYIKIVRESFSTVTCP